jgi:hypothetical protein
MCRILPIAPSCYHRYSARQRHPQRQCARAQRDQALIPEIQRVWHANWQVDGAERDAPSSG